MSLNIGALTGYIDLDDSPFDAGLSSALGKLRDFAPKGAKIAAAAGVGVATAFAGSEVGGMNIEAGNDKLAAQLGLTEAESARIGTVAGKVYAGAYGGSMEEVNTAVGAVMGSIEDMSTASGKKIERVTGTALNFAEAFDIDVQRAVASAGNVMNTGLAPNAKKAFDLIIAASQRVAPHLREDVLDASDEYGQFFATLGMGGEQAFALLVEASKKGQFGIDKIGDAVKEFTIRATDLGDSGAVEAYEAIGLNAETMATKILKGGDSARQGTRQVIDGLLAIKDPAKQAEAAVGLFGTPLEDLNKRDLPEFLASLKGGSDAMDGFGGAGKRLDTTLNENAIVALTSLKRQAQQAFLWLGEKALPIVNDVTIAMAENFGPALKAVGDFLQQPVIPALKKLATWINANRTPILIVAGLITALFIPHLIALGVTAVKTKVKVVASWVAQRAAAVKTAIVHSAAVVKMVAKWAFLGVKALLHAAKVAAAWFIALGPVGWVIATVIGLVALIILNWDKIKKFTGAAWDWIVSKLTGAWDDVKTAVVRKGGEVLQWFADLPGKIKDKLSGLAGDMKAAGVAAVEGIWDGIQSMGGWLADKIIGFVADKIPGPVRKALGISSPSRVMRDLARHVPEGLALGIEDGLLRVETASQRMAQATIPALGDMPGPRRPGDRPGGAGGGAMIKQYFPASATPEAAAAAAGGRTLAALAAMGV